MKLYRRMNTKLRRRRRGVTLVEMLVTLAVLLLMMALVVQIFQAATGSMNAAQIYQRLDDDLRRVDSTLRSDLAGVTAKLTPPNDPKDNRGYLEYGENEYADNDGEDVDDYIRFTAKAPAGRPFTGRMWTKPANVLNGAGASVPVGANDLTPAQRRESQPVTVTSEYAEIIYFLRNGNLYRRVLLVAPELQSRIVNSYSDTTVANTNLGYFPNSADGGAPTFAWGFFPNPLGGLQVSWQGVNDLSARPAARGLAADTGANNSVVLNTLGDLTDRHNRFAMPRFSDDFVLADGSAGPDGIPDDANGDNVPDWYPTLYPNVIDDTIAGGVTTKGLWNVSNPGAISGNANLFPRRFSLGFPFIFRGAYSQAQALNNYAIGWIHAPAPFATNGVGATPPIYQFDVDPVNYLRFLNHNPLDLGDNLPAPNTSRGNWQNLQSLWQFPTWRETLAPEWNDPTFRVNQPAVGHAFPNGLAPLDPAVEVLSGHVDRSTPARRATLLPPLTADWRGGRKAQPYTDGTGSDTGFFSGDPTDPLWAGNSWEDDLILTNVRSFDIKAFDPTLADYADLGWGDDWRITDGPNLLPGTRAVEGATSIGELKFLGTGNRFPYILGNRTAYGGGFPTYANPNAYALIKGSAYNVVEQTFAHEGRMPPLLNDWRYDSQYGAAVGVYDATLYPDYDGNIGDNSPGVARLRRVWDSWSTTYSKAPATGVRSDGFPYGPPFTPPIYPSYPPPYPAPLRGVQIQIRVTDPSNQRIKVLTIRQDFTDKL